MDRPHDRTKHRNLHGVIEYLKNASKVIKQRVRGVGGEGLKPNYAHQDRPDSKVACIVSASFL